MWSKMTPLTAGGSSLPHSKSTADLIVDQSGRFNRLQSAFQKQLKGLAKEFFNTYHTPLVLTDTVRTYEEQAQAHQAKPTLALSADNPHAMHPKGLAVDVDFGQSRKITPEMLARNGLYRPALSKGETWHLEPVSTKQHHRSSSRFLACSLSDNESVNGLSQANSTSGLFQQPESLDPVEQQGTGARGTPKDSIRRLHAAMEIESIFLEQLMGQMRRSMVDTVSASPQKLRGYLSMADQQLARALAAGGGLGLAQKIMENLASLETDPKTENHHEGQPPVPEKTGLPPGDKLV
jgi:Rod binding domain-containing protein